MMTLQEHVARIERSGAESRKFIDEQHALAAQQRDDGMPPWSLAIVGMFVGAALFAAGMLTARLLA